MLAWLPKERLHEGLIIAFQFALDAPLHLCQLIGRETGKRLALELPMLGVTAYLKTLSGIFEELFAVSLHPLI